MLKFVIIQKYMYSFFLRSTIRDISVVRGLKVATCTMPPWSSVWHERRGKTGNTISHKPLSFLFEHGVTLSHTARPSLSYLGAEK